MTARLSQFTNDIPILLHLTLSNVDATGYDETDLVGLHFFDARGQYQLMDLANVVLTEVSAAEFPGLYVLTGYPMLGDVSDPDTYLTKYAGSVRLKWDEAPGKFDEGYIDLDVDSVQAMVSDLHLLQYGKVLFDAAKSALVVYRDRGDGVLIPYKEIPLLDKDGGDVVLDGTGPASHEAAVEPS